MSRSSNCRAVKPKTTLSGRLIWVGTLCVTWCVACIGSSSLLFVRTEHLAKLGSIGHSSLAFRRATDQPGDGPCQQGQRQAGQRRVQRHFGEFNPTLILTRGHIQDGGPGKEKGAGCQGKGNHISFQKVEEIGDARDNIWHECESKRDSIVHFKSP